MSERESCPYTVQPFPHAFCKGCMFNGCYPWNTNPLLLCTQLKGLYPAMMARKNLILIRCIQRKPVTEDDWLSHLTDQKREAALNEDCRERAAKGEVRSSDLLPAEQLQYKHHQVTISNEDTMFLEERLRINPQLLVDNLVSQLIPALKEYALLVDAGIGFDETQIHEFGNKIGRCIFQASMTKKKNSD